MKDIEFKNEIWDLSRLITTGIELVFRPIVESFGLTMIQARILVGIERSGLSTVGGVGNLVGLSSGNASTMCKKLEKAGFIKRLRSLEDERLVKLVLTDEGRATLKKIDDVFREKYASLLEQWTEQDFTLIIAGMRKLSELISAMSMVD